MTRKRIIFPALNTAAVIEEPLPQMGPKRVMVRTLYNTVSPGTERANITGDPSVHSSNAPKVSWPRSAGYSCSGIVEEVGSEVTCVKPGDRVIVFWGVNSNINVVDEAQVVKITDERISMREAAMIFISTFSLAAIRKTRLELGESCMVMGLGLLGQFAVRLAHAGGAMPLIAVDPVESRREDALKGGADYALNPFDKGFDERVKEITGGGVNSAIEVTGQGAGLNETLDCMAQFGRVALLGCTRDKEFTVDYYRKVHRPGISLIGAHTLARPQEESYPGYFTHQDDIKAVMKLAAGGRLDLKSMLGPLYAPKDCQEVYTSLINDKNFPMVTQFDWSQLEV